MSLSVYWRLCLIFFFNAFLFFLDIFSVSRASCDPDSESGRDFTPAGNVSVNVSVNVPVWRNESLDADSECEWTDLLSYGQTLYMTGLLLGSLFAGAVSDQYGKRVVLLVSVCVHAVCGVLPAALPQPLLFLILRGLTGVSCSAINICSFSLGVEWSLPGSRMWPPAFLCFSFSLGTMALAPLAYISPTWTMLHLVLGLPQLLCLPLYRSIPESPRWLLLRRRTDVLDRYRRHSPADTHCLDLLLDTARTEVKATEAEEEPRPPAGHALCDMTHLNHPTILQRLAVMSYLGLVSALTYYGICMNVGTFGVDLYLAQFFSGLSEAPCLFVPLLLTRWGRRPISMLFLFLSGTACLLSLLVSRFCDQPVVVMGLALLGKLCILTTVLVSLLYSIELFPTVVRQRCVALANVCYRVGCVFNTLVITSPGIPLAAMIVYSGGPIIGCALCLLLPETRSVPLPDSVEDCDRQPRPHLPILASLWRRGQAMDGPASETEVLPGEKDPEQTLGGE
ncbi:solute carrier family 22 member 6 [Polymixia lowei]